MRAGGVRPAARHAILDLTRSLSALKDEVSRHARVLMVGAAMASSEKEFSELWDRAADLMADDGATLCTQLIATAKARGKLAASTAAAMTLPRITTLALWPVMFRPTAAAT